MVTGAAKPPRTVPESAMTVRSASTQVMFTDPLELTAMFSAKPAKAGSRVFTAVQVVLLAGRLAVLISRLPPSQVTIALPDPSMPITGPPKASVLTLTGALQVPPGGRTLDWITDAVVGPPTHATTARPFGAILATGAGPASLPVVRVTGADQVSPLALVLTSTGARKAVSLLVDQATTCAP